MATTTFIERQFACLAAWGGNPRAAHHASSCQRSTCACPFCVLLSASGQNRGASCRVAATWPDQFGLADGGAGPVACSFSSVLACRLRLLGVPERARCTKACGRGVRFLLRRGASVSGEPGAPGLFGRKCHGHQAPTRSLWMCPQGHGAYTRAQGPWPLSRYPVAEARGASVGAFQAMAKK